MAGEMPAPLRRLLAPTAYLPLGTMLTLAVRGLAQRRPAIFDRLGPHRRSSFLIAPLDYPVAFLVVPDGARASVHIVRGGTRPDADASIRAPLFALLGMLEGQLDGDALFFSRDVTLSGRTEALLALRNAIEDAELRPSDLLGLEGELARLVNRLAVSLANKARPVGAAHEVHG